MVRHSGEDLVDVESITIATVLPLQSAGINGSKFDAPQADRFTGYSDASFCEQIFDIAVAATARLRLNL